MDKINRIHLAKVPYEISITAQEDLKSYLHNINKQLDSDLAEETMADIEMRITEILNDRGVNKNDVITDKDIKAIKEQLGSPEQFSEEIPDIKNEQSTKSRKLFRDTDTALIGGVSGGLGNYLNLDPVLIRVAFILLTLLWGLGLLVYILLWIMVPPATTNSDKLMMKGEQVTAGALHRYRNNAQRSIANLRLRKLFIVIFKIFRVLVTIWAIMFILGLLTAIGFGSTILLTQPLHPIFVNYHLNYLLLSLIWLFIMLIIGLVIVVLLSLWRKQISSLKIATFTLLGVMVLNIVGILIVSPFVVNHYMNIYGDNKLDISLPVTTTGMVPASNFSLQASSNLEVSYEITNQPLHVTYQAYPGMGRPNINISNKNGTISVNSNNIEKVVPNCVLNWCKNIYLPVKVTIYGPSLKTYTAGGGTELNIENINQSNLTVNAQNYSDVNIYSSYDQNLNLSATNNSSISAEATTAVTTNVNVDNSSNIYSSLTTNLVANLPNICDQSLLELDEFPTTSTINGKPITNDSLSQNACVSINNNGPVEVPSPPMQGFYTFHRHIF